MKYNIHFWYLAQFFSEWEMCQKNVVQKNQRTYFMFNNFFPKNRAAFYIMWKNIAGLARLQLTIRRMHTACWIPKTTNTQSEYVMRFAFPLDNWLDEFAPVLCYTYFALLVMCESF